MKKVYKKENAITLVALVITIVILLILSGISISALTNTGLFGKAKEAKMASENAQKQESEKLDEYEKEMDQYGDNTLISNFNSGKIKVGDYIKYEPDKITDTDEDYKTLISNLQKYSGSTANTTESIKQENLNWRILDAKDGKIRLISDEATTSEINLSGYNGYNNLVKLLDDTCSILYGNGKFSNKTQNVKFEDIEAHMKNKFWKNPKIFTISNIKYPKILEREKGQTVVNGDNTYNGEELDHSEQTELIEQNEELDATTIKVNNTWFGEKMKEEQFVGKIYYEMLIEKNEYYLLSTRALNSNSAETGCSFDLIWIAWGKIQSNWMYSSSGNSNNIKAKFRPIITLNSSVQLDKVNSGDGSSPEKAYAIK